jgi:hypothetical protein
VKTKRLFSEMSIVLRIFLAVCVVATPIVLNIWILHFDPFSAAVTDSLLFLFALMLVFRPQWLDRWNRKEEERVKNWHSHPGQWS